MADRRPQMLPMRQMTQMPREGRPGRTWQSAVPLTRLLFVTIALAALSACASRSAAVPPVPAAPRHPDFIYPDVTSGVGVGQLAGQIERGWRYLQADNIKNAEREFASAIKTSPDAAAPRTALGYVELARQEFADAVGEFDRALGAERTYVPALVGRGQALLALGRDGEALASFEAALDQKPDVAGLQGRVDVLRFRAVQDNLARAKTAAEQSRWDEARAAYAQAIAASPDSAFLYRDRAGVERKAGAVDAALADVRQALTLDPNDARAHRMLGELLEEQGDPAAALAAYEKAQSLDPVEVPGPVIERARAAAALARMPAEYRAIPSMQALSRADLAALVAVRLAGLVSAVRPRQVVITDVRGHWAQDWITSVVRAGVMDTLPNYTFDPGASVRRADLAQTVNRALTLIAAQKPRLAEKWQGAQLSINDLPPSHLAYPAVSAAVASGVMQLLPDGTFQLLRPVTGAEALEIVGRLEALAAP